MNAMLNDSPSAQPSVTEHGDHAGNHEHGDCHHDHHHGHAHTDGQPAAFAADALLSARGLWFARSGRSILEGIDLDIRAGEIVTLIGPNGAGKTTLVRILLGLTRADRGTVQRGPGLTIGYVPQRFDIDRTIPMTVARFLQLASRVDDRHIATALSEVGASKLLKAQLSELSGGELQRVILARALVRSPNLLVLDEPVQGVDFVGEAELYGLIGQLRTRRGLGVLLVSHDLHVVMAQSDRVICVNRHVCCSGVPDAVAKDPAYERLFGSHAARAFAIYSHHHDHRHDLAGDARPVADGSAGNGQGR